MYAKHTLKLNTPFNEYNFRSELFTSTRIHDVVFQAGKEDRRGGPVWEARPQKISTLGVTFFNQCTRWTYDVSKTRNEVCNFLSQDLQPYAYIMFCTSFLPLDLYPRDIAGLFRFPILII